MAILESLAALRTPCAVQFSSAFELLAFSVEKYVFDSMESFVTKRAVDWTRSRKVKLFFLGEGVFQFLALVSASDFSFSMSCNDRVKPP